MSERPRKLIDLLRCQTGSDDLLRVLLKAQAGGIRTSEETLDGQTRVRVTALDARGPSSIRAGESARGCRR